MDFIKYEIKQGDTLESIAKENNISVDEMLDFHNSNSDVTQQIYSNHIPFHINSIYISIEKKDLIIPISADDGKMRARYRCEQTNKTIINTVLTSYTNIKTQVLVEQNLDNNTVKTKVEEFIYDVLPPFLSGSFELVKATDFIKNNASFKLSDNGKLNEIVNAEEILNDWEEFKKNDLRKLPFINSLEKSPNIIKEIEDAGDKQFKNPNVEEYQRILFNFICFDQFLYRKFEEFEPESFLYRSTIIPSVIIPLNFRYDKVKEDNEILTIKKTADSLYSEKLISDLKAGYNEFLKTTILFSFTEFKLFFTCTIDFNIKDRVVEKARVILKEEIADNIENTCEFTLSRLQNYKPH